MSETKHERMARIEGIDLDTGTFSMTLATEGEASDGDILSIKGGQIPERMPMLTSHWNDPSAQLGSITNPEKLLKDSPPRLKAVGHIEMSGEGVSAEIRRDLAHMIDKGHVTGVSIRWDDVPGKSVRRVNLPSDHPYFVEAETEKDYRKRYGIYFEEWRAMAEDIDPSICRRDTLIDYPTNDIEDEDVDPEARTAAALAALRTEAGFCQGIGASHADMINAVVDGSDADIEAVEFNDCVIFLPAPVADQLRARLEPEVIEDLEEPVLDPEPAPEASADQPSPMTLDIAEVANPVDVEAFTEAFTAALDEADERYRQFAKDLVKLAQGKV